MSVVLAVNNLPLGDAITIIYSGPVFTMILSTICFKTRLGLFKVFLACLLVSGIVLVAKPSSIFPDGTSENCTLGTVFENHRKSLIQHCELRSYVYILSGQKFIKNAKNGLILAST